ncbi:MAG TPA: hypothetical protein DHN29_11250 [Cytophagales bacterium]|nr:hypothetical protein [Cytophagales bacterium]
MIPVICIRKDEKTQLSIDRLYHILNEVDGEYLVTDDTGAHIVRPKDWFTHLCFYDFSTMYKYAYGGLTQ